MSAITEAAKGEPCTIRIPGICNHNPETTVACHRNGGGMARKRIDIYTAFGCSDCHAYVDGGWTQYETTLTEVLRLHYEGIFETQEILIQKGLLAYADMEVSLTYKALETCKRWVKKFFKSME